MGKALLFKFGFLLILVSALGYNLFFEGGLEGFNEGYQGVPEKGRNLRSVHLQPLNKDTIRLRNNLEDSIIIIPGYVADIHVYGDGEGKKGQAWLVFFKALVGLPLTLIGIIFFIKLYKFIASVGRQSVFTLKNIKRLSFMGWACFGLAAGFVLFDLLSFWEAKNALADIPYKIIPDFHPPFFLLLFGLVLHTISYVFKSGLELQQENDLTV